MVELLGAAGRGDDLGVLDQLVAPDVVGVGVGVDHLADILRRRRGVAHDVEHFLGQGDGEQGVDQQGLLAVDDQPGVRPAPAAVGQEIGEQPVTDIVQALGVLPFRHYRVLLPIFSFSGGQFSAATGAVDAKSRKR